MTTRDFFALGLLLLIAAVFRLPHLATVPPGLYPDEAINGNDAVRTADSCLPFYEDNNGREGLLICLVAVSFKTFGISIWSLRLVSAMAGLLTVLGLWFLVRAFSDSALASLAAFFLAVSFWHVNFSRIAFAGILAPMCAVWMMYFLWRALATLSPLAFIGAGLFLGLGLYTYIAFRVMPLVIALVVAASWRGVRQETDPGTSAHVRRSPCVGLALMIVVAGAIVTPLGLYFWRRPASFAERLSQVSVFASSHVLRDVLSNTVHELAMFNGAGDRNWRHNIGGAPELVWPVGACFVIGLVINCIELVRRYRTRRQVPTIQAFLLSWFFIGLLPAVFSNEGIPHALRSILVVPVAMIFAAEGLRWLYTSCHAWLRGREQHIVPWALRASGTGNLIAATGLTLFLGAVGWVEYDRYFSRWAKNPLTAEYFDRNYVDLGRRLNAMPQDVTKYVLVNAPGILVNGIPMPAQTVMFITDTATAARQRERNLHYLTERQFHEKQYDRESVVVPMEPLK